MWSRCRRASGQRDGTRRSTLVVGQRAAEELRVEQVALELDDLVLDPQQCQRRAPAFAGGPVQRDNPPAAREQLPAEPGTHETRSAGDQGGVAGTGLGGVPLPDGPRRPAAGPQVVEHHRVLVGVHAVPKAGVPKGAQLPGGRQAAEGLRSSTLSAAR